MFFWKKQKAFNNLQNSRLFDETSFYDKFIKDLQNCKREVIIESPYITSYRMNYLYPIFYQVLKKGVKIHIFTRDPVEHNEYFLHQSTNEILKCAEIGINMALVRGNHHRKLAILDRGILWEGSLNILSQFNSYEIMRRIENKRITSAMLSFIRLPQLI